MKRFEVFSVEFLNNHDAEELGERVDRFCENRDVIHIETKIVQGWSSPHSTYRPRMIVTVTYNETKVV